MGNLQTVIDEKGIRTEVKTGPEIYKLIGKAMAEIGAIGKDSKNEQQGFRYRGIDAVYNALNPVMAKHGLFITPEILDHKREERTTTKTWNGQQKTTTLIYSIITVRYTVYAPDGSNVQITVIGEGMDSGDKATNKAMSIAMKYAMFQLFMIPTEAVDPDSECHEVDPKTAAGLPTGYAAGMQMLDAARGQNVRPAASAKNATVEKAASLPERIERAVNPQTAPAPAPAPAPETPAAYIKRQIAALKKQDPAFDFLKARASLIQSGTIEDIPSATMTMDQARSMMEAVNKNFFQEN